ncbi:hypothetical protein HY988_01470 [Candidatus Micrarchaeota archaeon]|nr:hypothetical protein [Candidatus Micrarchaeota archaeon]
MRTQFVLFILIAIFLIGSVAIGMMLNDFYKANAPRTCEDFIQVGYVWLPESVSRIFMNDSVILHFSTINNDQITAYGIVRDHGIFDLGCQPIRNPDAEVSMSDLTAIELATSAKPITTFVIRWRAGKIRIKTYNSETERKLAYADQLLATDYEPVPPLIRAMFGKFLS